MSVDNEIPEGQLVTINLHEKYVTLMVIAIADQYQHYSWVAKSPKTHPSVVSQAEEFLRGFRHCMHAFDTENEGLIEELNTIDNNTKKEFDNVIEIDKKREEKNETFDTDTD